METHQDGAGHARRRGNVQTEGSSKTTAHRDTPSPIAIAQPGGLAAAILKLQELMKTYTKEELIEAMNVLESIKD